MTWNYRIIHSTHTLPTGDIEHCYAIHEVYYDEHDAIETWTVNPTFPSGETREELAKDIEFYQQALMLPVLELTELDSNANDEGGSR